MRRLLGAAEHEAHERSEGDTFRRGQDGLERSSDKRWRRTAPVEIGPALLVA